MLYLYLTGFWQASGGASIRQVTGCGRVGSQQVVEGGGHCSILGGCLLFLSLCSSGFQDLLRLNPPSLLMLLGCISISMASLMRPSM